MINDGANNNHLLNGDYSARQVGSLQKLYYSILIETPSFSRNRAQC